MERPGGVPHYRYGPGASYREGLEHNLIETIFEDRTALEAVMKDFIGSHGKIAGLITSTLRLFQRDVHTMLGRSSDISRRSMATASSTTHGWPMYMATVIKLSHNLLFDSTIRMVSRKRHHGSGLALHSRRAVLHWPQRPARA